METDVVAISLFSGAGGLDIGSIRAGVPVVVSTDINGDCIETLKANSNYFGDSEIIHGDLHEIDSSVFSNILTKRKHDKFIVIGGAPCQPFSKMGYWIPDQSGRGINDPRATLVNEYLRVVGDLQPDGFVFENVESLLYPRTKIVADEFLRIVKSYGYRTIMIKANALDYGVPQKRKRLFIMGTKGEFKTAEPRRTHCDPKQQPLLGLEPWVNVGPVITPYSSEEFFEPEEVAKGNFYDDLCEVPPGWNYKALTAWAGHPNPKYVAAKRYWNFLLKLSPDKPSWTITAQPGPWVGPFHWDNRRLRIPEQAAIQTFPSDYVFCGSHKSKQKQIGNAVPSLMAKAMIEFVKESLE